MSVRQEIPTVVLAPNGDAISGATIYVNVRGGTQATVYADETSATTLSQPLTTDASGRITGWLSRGQYEVQINAAGYPSRVEALDVVPAGDGSVDRALIADAAINNVKLATASVGEANLISTAGQQAVTAAVMRDGAVTPKKIASVYDQYLTNQTADLAITGLDGNVDKGYEIEVMGMFNVVSGTGDRYMLLHPNNDRTARYSGVMQDLAISGGSPVSTLSQTVSLRPTTGMVLAQNGWALNTMCVGKHIFLADGISGNAGRPMLSDIAGRAANESNNHNFRYIVSNYWHSHSSSGATAQTAPVTRLDISFGGGSFTGLLRIRKLVA